MCYVLYNDRSLRVGASLVLLSFVVFGEVIFSVISIRLTSLSLSHELPRMYSSLVRLSLGSCHRCIHLPLCLVQSSSVWLSSVVFDVVVFRSQYCCPWSLGVVFFGVIILDFLGYGCVWFC